MTTLKLGTRGSPLALFQAHAVERLLRERAGVAVEIVVIKTTGDRLSEAALSPIGGKQLFVKEIEDALLAGDIEIAVHSSKDLPAELPEGLEIAAVLAREDPRDVFVLPGGPEPVGSLDGAIRRIEAAASPRIGTSSVRRSAQLARLFHSPVAFVPIRGNLDTRLRKLDAGEFDVLVLAAAGLRRLQRADRISATLPADVCVPAPGQGIIAIEARGGDARTRELLALIDDEPSATALRAERAVVSRLGGGCQLPIGAHAELSKDALVVTAIVISPDGARAARTTVRGDAGRPEVAGAEAAERLLDQGAREILAAVLLEQARTEGARP